MTTFSIVAIGADCKAWFKNSKIKPGPKCIDECVVHEVGLGTFTCSDQCKSLCAEPQTFSRNILKGVVQLYPSLTKAERAFAEREPSKALKAWSLSRDAEKACKTIIPTSNTNDESDACRHFVWAGLLRREINLDTAKTVLDAHEEDPDQPERERVMDIANNNHGLTAAERLIEQKKFSTQEMLTTFVEELRAGRMTVNDRKIKDLERFKR